MEQEQVILEKVRQLPPEQLQEVLDFIEFLQQRERQRQWISFDAWAMNLAKEKGFQHLTEDDIAQIVKAHRKRALS
jgi:hypothetical protein